MMMMMMMTLLLFLLCRGSMVVRWRRGRYFVDSSCSFKLKYLAAADGDPHDVDVDGEGGGDDHVKSIWLCSRYHYTMMSLMRRMCSGGYMYLERSCLKYNQI